MTYGAIALRIGAVAQWIHGSSDFRAVLPSNQRVLTWPRHCCFEASVNVTAAHYDWDRRYFAECFDGHLEEVKESLHAAANCCSRWVIRASTCAN